MRVLYLAYGEKNSGKSHSLNRMICEIKGIQYDYEQTLFFKENDSVFEEDIANDIEEVIININDIEHVFWEIKGFNKSNGPQLRDILYTKLYTEANRFQAMIGLCCMQISANPNDTSVNFIYNQIPLIPKQSNIIILTKTNEITRWKQEKIQQVKQSFIDYFEQQNIFIESNQVFTELLNVDPHKVVEVFKIPDVRSLMMNRVHQKEEMKNDDYIMVDCQKQAVRYHLIIGREVDISTFKESINKNLDVVPVLRKGDFVCFMSKEDFDQFRDLNNTKQYQLFKHIYLIEPDTREIHINQQFSLIQNELRSSGMQYMLQSPEEKTMNTNKENYQPVIKSDFLRQGWQYYYEGTLLCFSVDCTLTNDACSSLPIDEASVDCRVLSWSTKNLQLLHSPCIGYLHKDVTTLASFIRLQTSNGQWIELSDYHLIYCTQQQAQKFQYACHIEVMDQLLSVKGDWETVTKIDRVVKKGFFAPLTREGTIIVNGFYASCYANCHSHQLAHFAMSPLRIFSEFIGVLESGVHPYAQFLIKCFPMMIKQ